MRRVMVVSVTMMAGRLGGDSGGSACCMMVVMMRLGGAYRRGEEGQGQEGERGLNKGFHAGFPFIGGWSATSLDGNTKTVISALTPHTLDPAERKACFDPDRLTVHPRRFDVRPR